MPQLTHEEEMQRLQKQIATSMLGGPGYGSLEERVELYHRYHFRYGDAPAWSHPAFTQGRASGVSVMLRRLPDSDAVLFGSGYGTKGFSEYGPTVVMGRGQLEQLRDAISKLLQELPQ